MCHSTPISEPLAHALGLLVGLLAYGGSCLFTGDVNAQLWCATAASVITNIAIGAKINIVTLDILALLVVRPISAVAAGPILVGAVNALVR